MATLAVVASAGACLIGCSGSALDDPAFMGGEGGTGGAGAGAGGGGGAGGAPCDPSLPSGWRAMAPMSSAGTTLPATEAGAAWTGEELILAGCATDGVEGMAALAYAPATDAWRPLAPPPRDLNYTVGQWSGTEVLLWGGADCSFTQLYMDGIAYDPAADAWRSIPPAPLDPRGSKSASILWATTTGELIVWGGVTFDSEMEPIEHNDGAAYSPVTDSWRVIAPSPLAPRQSHRAVWNGSRMIVFGGQAYPDVILGDAAAYDPLTDTWTTIAVPPEMAARQGHLGLATGSSLSLATFWGGASEANYDEDGMELTFLPDGGAYDASTDTWALVPALSIPAPWLPFITGWWGAGRLWSYWGQGWGVPPGAPPGAAFDPATGAWSDMPEGPSVGGRVVAAAWSGCEEILIGDIYSDHQGAIFRP